MSLGRRTNLPDQGIVVTGPGIEKRIPVLGAAIAVALTLALDHGPGVPIHVKQYEDTLYLAEKNEEGAAVLYPLVNVHE